MQIIITLILVILYCVLDEYLDNRKQKQNKYIKTTAKVIKLKTNWHNHKVKEHDLDSIQRYTIEFETRSYSFIYEYIVNERTYTGDGHSIFKKKNGQDIQIYYDENNPEKSEIALKDKNYINILTIIGISLIIYFIRMQL